jgi:hypothetical protein
MGASLVMDDGTILGAALRGRRTRSRRGVGMRRAFLGSSGYTQKFPQDILQKNLNRAPLDFVNR